MLLFSAFLWWIKSSNLFQIEMFCNINVFNLTFDQFNASLLSKNVFLSKIKPTESYWSQTFTDPKHSCKICVFHQIRCCFCGLKIMVILFILDNGYDMIKYFRVYLCLKEKKKKKNSVKLNTSCQRSLVPVLRLKLCPCFSWLWMKRGFKIELGSLGRD